MALDGDTLGLLMLANVNALTDVQKRDRTAVFKALGQAVVSHITAHAQVPAATAMAIWMTQVEGVANGVAPLSVLPLSATFNASPGIGTVE